MTKKTAQTYSSMKTLFIGNPARSWPQYFEKLAEKLRVTFPLVVAHCWTLLLFHGLTTPFGIFLYLFCCTYRFFPTQTAAIFPSQIWAGYYVWLLLSCSVLLPILILIPPVRGFLYSLLGEQIVEERVGKSGARPLIAALLGPFFLYYLDTTTRSLQPVPDHQHWHEVNVKTDKIEKENNSYFFEKLDAINQDSSITSPEERKEKTRTLWNEHIYRRDQIQARYDQVADLIQESKESQNGVVAQLGDRIKDFFRGNDKNRSFWILDRALPGGRGLDQYDHHLENIQDSTKKGSHRTNLESYNSSFGEKLAGLNPSVEKSGEKK